METGKRIRELRQARGMSQEDLGKIVGVRRAAVNKWETGKTKNLKRDVIQKLSEFFGVSPSYLMGMTNIPKADAISVQRIPVLGSIAAGDPILASGVTVATGWTNETHIAIGERRAFEIIILDYPDGLFTYEISWSLSLL